MKRLGGCACGEIRFEVTEDFLGSGACHCTDCQKLSGGGANYVALAQKGSVKLLQGEPKRFQKPGASGGIVARAFCPSCGTPLWSEPAHEPFIPVKVGALDDSSDLAPQMDIYVSSAPAWHSLTEGAPHFPKMPEMA
ncbi:MAG: GFA family protein [Maritimibacter sp.]